MDQMASKHALVLHTLALVSYLNMKQTGVGLEANLQD